MEIAWLQIYNPEHIHGKGERHSSYKPSFGRVESKGWEVRVQIISPGSVNQSAEQRLSLLPLQVFWLPQYPDLARIKGPHAMIQAAPWAQWELHGVNKTCLENKTEYK